MLTYILFLLGFGLLIKGADWLVGGASALAKRLGVPALVIGLTVVSFGTSAPEFVVSLVAALRGSSSIAIGNILGSNIANTLVILGVAAIIYPLAVGRGTVWKEIPMSVLAAALLAVLANDHLIDGRGFSEISRIDGLVLLAFFVIFIYYTFSISRVSSASPARPGSAEAECLPPTATDEAVPAAERSLAIALALVAIGLACLVLGGHWVVNGAVALARALGASESVIALTVVALGTSLPELAASAVAAYRKNVDIAVGNAVGSNIFNVFLIVGASAVVRPLSFAPEMNINALMAVGASVLLFLIMFVGKRHVLERYQGALFVGLYLAYVAYLVIGQVV